MNDLAAANPRLARILPVLRWWPLANVYASLFLVASVLVVAPLAAYLPMASVAAILFLIAYGLIDVGRMKAIFRTSRSESAVMFVTLGAALFLGLQTAIYAGVLLSLMLFLNQAARPGIRDVKPDRRGGTLHFDADTGLPDCPQLKMLRVNGSIFFGAVEHVEDAFHRVDAESPQQKHLLVVASGINVVDISGAELLAREAERRRNLSEARPRNLPALHGADLFAVPCESAEWGAARGLTHERWRPPGRLARQVPMLDCGLLPTFQVNRMPKCLGFASALALFAAGNTYLDASNFALGPGGTLLMLANDSLSPNSALTLGDSGGGMLDMGARSGMAAAFAGSPGSALQGATGQKLTINGAVALNDTTLTPSVAGSPAPGTVFTILDKTGAGAITGTFNGLAEGATVTVGAST